MSEEQWRREWDSSPSSRQHREAWIRPMPQKTGIPTCVYGVGRQLESNIHAPNENVRIADLEGFARFLIELLR